MHRFRHHMTFQRAVLSGSIILLLSALNLGIARPAFAEKNDQDLINRIKPVGELNIVDPAEATDAETTDPVKKSPKVSSDTPNGETATDTPAVTD